MHCHFWLIYCCGMFPLRSNTTCLRVREGWVRGDGVCVCVCVCVCVAFGRSKSVLSQPSRVSSCGRTYIFCFALFGFRCWDAPAGALPTKDDLSRHTRECVVSIVSERCWEQNQKQKTKQKTETKLEESLQKRLPAAG